MRRSLWLILGIIGLMAQLGSSQVFLDNASFEDEPADATVPHGWFPCESGTTPDILPGFWGVYEEASDGETYVGLITRTDGSFESIGQRLSSPLEEETCYKFSLDLAKSDNYSGYNNSLKLRVWITNKKCKKQQLIFESDFIENEDWETFMVEFKAESKAKYIIIEAHYSEKAENHKGNIMIDNISPIVFCNQA